MNTAILRIDGMACEGCAETVQAVLTAESGVRTAVVSFADRRARILYDPGATDERRLVAAIERVGFKAARSSPA